MPGFSGTCRLLVLDIDGTFLNSAKAVTAAVRDAVICARLAGCEVSFATGRMFEAIRPWVEDLGLTTPQIANNGADVVQPHTRQRLRHRCLSPATVGWLLERGAALGFVPVLFSGDRVLATARTPDQVLLERNHEFVTVVSPATLSAPGLDVEKLLFLSQARADELPDLCRELQAAAAVDPALGLVAGVSERGILNVCAPEATKLAAIAWLCTHLGCALGDVVAVGDGDNDVDMLAGVGLGVAMGNASPRARAAARQSVPDHDHDGLAVAIREFVLPAVATRPTARGQTDGAAHPGQGSPAGS